MSLHNQWWNKLSSQKHGTCLPLRCVLSQHQKSLHSSWRTHHYIWKCPCSQYQWTNPHNGKNNQVCHFLRCQSVTCRHLHLCQRNGTPTSYSHVNGMSTTQKFNPMQKLHSYMCSQWYHNTLKNQMNRHAISLAPLPRFSRKIPLLLGTWHLQPRKLK